MAYTIKTLVFLPSEKLGGRQWQACFSCSVTRQKIQAFLVFCSGILSTLPHGHKGGCLSRQHVHIGSKLSRRLTRHDSSKLFLLCLSFYLKIKSFLKHLLVDFTRISHWQKLDPKTTAGCKEGWESGCLTKGNRMIKTGLKKSRSIEGS